MGNLGQLASIGPVVIVAIVTIGMNLPGGDPGDSRF